MGEAMTTKEQPTLTPEERKLIHQYQCAAMVYGFNEMARTATDLGEKTFFRGMREGAAAQARDAGIEVLVAKNGWPTVLTLQAQPHVTFDERDIELMRKCVARHDEVRGSVALPRDLVVSLMLDSEHLPEPKRTERVVALNSALEPVPAPTEPMVTVPRKAVEAALARLDRIGLYQCNDQDDFDETCRAREALRSAMGEP